MRCTVAAALVLVMSTGVAEARLVSGMLDKEVIRREIQKHLPKFSACYERALDKQPGRTGSVHVRFTILLDGSVAEVEAKGMPAIDACVARAMTTVVFPKPPGVVHVNYPFTFRPA